MEFSNEMIQEGHGEAANRHARHERRNHLTGREQNQKSFQVPRAQADSPLINGFSECGNAPKGHTPTYQDLILA
jgi:hypothetical protein